jgi:tRNA pseudouridine55 synthase
VERTGFLLIDKPAGITSHDVVDRTRKLFSTRKIGHAGTLDPPATGLLILAVGASTRLLRYFDLVDKRYTAEIVFGATTPTLDSASDITEIAPARFSEQALSEVLSGMVGEIEQRPPAVSAVKVAGEPLYKKARRGETVEVAPRKQFIFSLDLVSGLVELEDGRLSAVIDVRCDSGTYVRALAADIAAKLGTVAYVNKLRRTGIGPFDVGEAVTLDYLAGLPESQRWECLVTPTEALRFLPAVDVSAAEKSVLAGRRLSVDRDVLSQLFVEIEHLEAEFPFVVETMRRKGLLDSRSGTDSRPSRTGENELRGGLLDKAREVAEMTTLTPARAYRGPVVLVTRDPEGRASLLGVARISGSVLAYDCVLAKG